MATVEHVQAELERLCEEAAAQLTMQIIGSPNFQFYRGRVGAYGRAASILSNVIAGLPMYPDQENTETEEE